MYIKTLQKIRQIRNDKNLTQEFVADKIGISQSHYAKLENGKVKLSIEILQKISTVFKLSVSELLE